MSSALRVDPAHLRKSASAQNEVSHFVSALAAGQSMAGAGTGMAGLECESACEFAGTAFDTATSAVNEELTSHATKLMTAADRYQQADEELGRRLRRIAGSAQ